ncbi:MAG: AraC family transcriptional regulator [Deltaproteobacteria bacterium]|nr:AraC family transcriptional regulator [Deltaproteobacteria bacterium]
MRTSAAPILQTVMLAAEALGLSRARITTALGLRWEDLAAYDLRVPSSTSARLWQELAAWRGTPLVSAEIARQIARTEGGGILELTIRSGATIADAAARLTAILPLLFGEPDSFHSITRRSGDGWELGYCLPVGGEPPVTLSEECLIVTFVELCRASADDFRPDRVYFQHAPTAPVHAWSRELGCPVQFDAPFYGVRIGDRAYRAPVRTHDPQLASLLAQLGRALLTSTRTEVSATHGVRKVIHELVAQRQRVDVDAVARALHVSPRTLQRRLTIAGTTFRKELDAVRRAIAEVMLPDLRYSLGEIAALLGFADASQFSRAVRGWTGQTPRSVRAQARAHAA